MLLDEHQIHNLKKELNNGFKPDEQELLGDLTEAAESAWETDEGLFQYAKRITKLKLKTYIEPIRANCSDTIELAERSLERIREAVAAEGSFLSGLIEKRHNALSQDLEPSPPRLTLIFQPVFYAIVIVFSGCVLYEAVQLVSPGMSKLSAVMPALLAPAPSTLLTYLCYRKGKHESRDEEEKQEKFVRAIYWVSFIAAITMCVFYAVSKLFASWLLTSSASFSAQNMFSAQPKVNYVEMIQQISAFIAFVSSFLSEIGFTSSLMLTFYSFFTRHAPIERLDREIKESRERIEDMESQEADTIATIGRYRILRNSVLDNWAAEKMETIIFHFKIIISKIKSRIFKELPIYEMKALANNGNPTDPDSQQSQKEE